MVYTDSNGRRTASTRLADWDTQKDNTMMNATASLAQTTVDSATRNRAVAVVAALIASQDLAQAQDMSSQSIRIADFAGMITSELDMDAARKALVAANKAIFASTSRAFAYGVVTAELAVAA